MDPADPGPPGGYEVPVAVLRSWDQAEAQLFPLIMAQPDLYKQALEMVAVLAAGLRESCPDLAALLAAHARGAALAESGVAGVRPELIAAAACATRYRELVTVASARRRLAALARARDQGAAWAVVEERGDEARAPYIPYCRVEAHVPTGRAVIVSVEPDEMMSAVHRLDAAELDLATGALRAGEPLGSYDGPDALARALDQARADITARPGR